ncbi:hypothetical protein [Spirosoma linguale]|uniref:Uncharacterized protein n=1 Tax=Spirosoma linguale (strain ATCC 33905 / DSM 74 / LMG 10896 / Claus 1) TaxID=504472 RepID=D2QLI4_SPILD|nr:hypothetical protein Slin_3120 [Spirosoma linguale DSM 74]
MKIQLQGDAFVVIDDAILDQQVIQIKVKKKWRTIEPYMTGLDRNSLKSVVYGFCRDMVPSPSYPSRWQRFDLDDIDAIEVTNYSFDPHVDYEGEDDCMLTVYRKLKPAWTSEELLQLCIAG